MRRGLLAALTIAALTAAFAANPSSAQQGQLPLPGFRPPPAPPIKPYQAVAVTPPATLNDPGFIGFRKQLGEVTARKDRGALAKMVVTQDFFWIPQDKDLADAHKSGIDNLFYEGGNLFLHPFVLPTNSRAGPSPAVFCFPFPVG